VREFQGLSVLGPARLVEDLSQASEDGPGLLALPELVMGHGQESQARWEILDEAIGSRQILDRFLVSACAVEGRAKAEAILPPIGGQAAGVLRLEQGEAILEDVEIRLPNEGPARPAIRLRVGLLVIAVHK
jgi:hypothetical protein